MPRSLQEISIGWYHQSVCLVLKIDVFGTDLTCFWLLKFRQRGGFSTNMVTLLLAPVGINAANSFTVRDRKLNSWVVNVTATKATAMGLIPTSRNSFLSQSNRTSNRNSENPKRVKQISTTTDFADFFSKNGPIPASFCLFSFFRSF